MLLRFLDLIIINKKHFLIFVSAQAYFCQDESVGEGLSFKELCTYTVQSTLYPLLIYECKISLCVCVISVGKAIDSLPLIGI